MRPTIVFNREIDHRAPRLASALSGACTFIIRERRTNQPDRQTDRRSRGTIRYNNVFTRRMNRAAYRHCHVDAPLWIVRKFFVKSQNSKFCIEFVYDLFVRSPESINRLHFTVRRPRGRTSEFGVVIVAIIICYCLNKI